MISKELFSDGVPIHPSVQDASLSCKLPWRYLWALLPLWGSWRCLGMGYNGTIYRYPIRESYGKFVENLKWGKWWLTMIHRQLWGYPNFRKTHMLLYKPNEIVYAFQQVFFQQIFAKSILKSTVSLLVAVQVPQETISGSKSQIRTSAKKTFIAIRQSEEWAQDRMAMVCLIKLGGSLFRRNSSISFRALYLRCQET